MQTSMIVTSVLGFIVKEVPELVEFFRQEKNSIQHLSKNNPRTPSLVKKKTYIIFESTAYRKNIYFD